MKERDRKVLAVLIKADKPIGPTEISKTINEEWCMVGQYFASSKIMPSLKRLIASGAIICPMRGKYIAKRS